MGAFFLLVIAAVIMQRLLELRIARRNARYILSQGGFEAGREHYKYLVGLHLLFFLALALEVGLVRRPLSSWWWIPFSLFLLAQFVRYWCIRSLGPYWNTRIFVLPGAKRVARGPYRHLRHPNYLIVCLELLLLPLTFSAYLTAVVFPLANLWLLLRIRIPAEEQAWREYLEKKINDR